MFEALRPVLITFRCVLRLNLLGIAGIKELLAKQLALNSERCRVDVLAWAIQSNHVHLLVRQAFDGHCPDRRAGISAFIRNVASVTARYGNERATLAGHFWECTFRSQNVRTIGDLIRYFAYIHGQNDHHGVRASAVDEALVNSALVLCGGRPDGLVEWLPEDPGMEGLDLATRCDRFSTLIARIAELACAEERRLAAMDLPERAILPQGLEAMQRDAWRQATHQAAQEMGLRGLHLDARDCRFRSLAEFVDLNSISAARERLLRYVWERNDAQPRAAPKLGGTIDVRVTYSKPARSTSA